MDNKQNIRIFLAIILIMLMAFAANVTGCRETMIPEIAALTVGFWVQDKQIWRINRWQTLLLLTVIALSAVLIVRWIPLPLTARVGIIFVIVSSLLLIMNVTLTPAFAVGMLPMLLGIDDLIYPVVVFVLASILMTGQWLMNKTGLRIQEELHHTIRPTWHTPLRWLALLLACMPLMIPADMMGYKFCFAPPFIVAFIELSNSKGGFRFRLVQTWGMLLMAAVFGSVGQWLLHLTLGIPEPIAVLVAEGLVFLMFHIVGKRFAPAAALALMPFVVPHDIAPYFPIFAIVGATYFILVAHLFFIREDKA
jgi:hypothetical protein